MNGLFILLQIGIIITGFLQNHLFLKMYPLAIGLLCILLAIPMRFVKKMRYTEFELAGR